MSKKAMKEMIMKLSGKHSVWDIFNDFLELSTMSISCTADKFKRKERKEKYMQITSKYNKDELKILSNMLGELAVTLENNISDVLGELFMELQLGGKWNGQFFTPYHICQLIAAVNLNKCEEIINNKGYVAINEPSCGGGALIMAMVETMKNKGYNPQQQLKVTCKDLELKSVYMTYIQLSLLGIPAEVCYANSLNLKEFDKFRTPNWMLGLWKHRKTDKEAYCG